MPSLHLDMREDIKPIEENGFMIEDITQEAIVHRHFRWNSRRDPVEAIDSLQPFRVTEMKRPG